MEYRCCVLTFAVYFHRWKGHHLVGFAAKWDGGDGVEKEGQIALYLFGNSPVWKPSLWTGGGRALKIRE
jgi:hypothetical protein